MSRDRWLSARDPDTVRSLTPATPSCRKAYLLGFAYCRRIVHLIDSQDWRRAVERAVQADLVRCILGDPWRPRINRAPLRSSVMRAAATLAHKIYNERLFGEMPLLADALERAGCHDEQVLGHLRGPGPHALGCHVLDALTGRAGPVAGSAAGSLAATSEPLPYRRICVG